MRANHSSEQEDGELRRPLRQMGRAALWTTAAVALPAGLLTVVAHFMSQPVLFAQLSPFRVQYAALLGAFALICLCARRPRLTSLFGALGAFNAAVVAHAVLRDAPTPVSGAKPLRVVCANVLSSNPDSAALLGFIRTENPDLVCLLEINQRWRAELEASTLIRERYPFRRYVPREDNFGLAVLSRTAPDGELAPVFVDPELPSLELSFSESGELLRVLVTHPMPPGSENGRRLRDRQLAAIGEWHRADSAPTLILGDLNATPWCPPLRRLLADTGLRNAAGDSRQLAGTWPATVSFLLIPLDHALLGPGLACASYRVGPFIGSDHYPLLLEVVPAETGRAR